MVNFAEAIAPSITRIFNESLSQAKVPPAWKTSNVTHIPKGGGDPTRPSNYRPVSLLSLISKVLERIIHKRISNFLYSLSQVLVWFPSTIIYTGGITHGDTLLPPATHPSLSSCLCVFDIRKAFDSQPHCKILSALSTIGINFSTGSRTIYVIDDRGWSLTAPPLT